MSARKGGPLGGERRAASDDAKAGKSPYLLQRGCVSRCGFDEAFRGFRDTLTALSRFIRCMMPPMLPEREGGGAASDIVELRIARCSGLRELLPSPKKLYKSTTSQAFGPGTSGVGLPLGPPIGCQPGIPG